MITEYRPLFALRDGDVILFQDEKAVLEVLASQPAPEQILALQASPELQARVTDLLDRSARKELTGQEEAELDRHLVLEHLVRLAKVHSYKALSSRA